MSDAGGYVSGAWDNLYVGVQRAGCGFGLWRVEAMRFRCAHCGKAGDKRAGEVNRARAAGLRLFCNRRCAGLSRRKHKTEAQRKLERKLYDKEYRLRDPEMMKARKRAYHEATYDPEKQRRYNQRRMAHHVEYCRRPEYKRWKAEYDRQLRASAYGAFAEAFTMLLDINREVRKRISHYDKYEQNQTQNKAQSRRRDTGQQGRDDSGRRDHPATYR